MIMSTPLPSPQQLRQALMLPEKMHNHATDVRKKCAEALSGNGFVLVVGPCSLHDSWSARMYAERLVELQGQLPCHWTIIMRAFVEKSRTCGGWKGMLHGTEALNEAASRLKSTRHLLLQLLQSGIAVGSEIVSPMLMPYIEDLLSWGCVGARSTSQTHRECASGVPFPIGFKNSLDGQFDVAIASAVEARRPQSFFSIDEHGHIAAFQSAGNPSAHIISRGAQNRPNYGKTEIDGAIAKLNSLHLPPYLLVDCSHGNSGFQPLQQLEVAVEACTHDHVAGLLIESHHSLGKQPERSAIWSPFLSVTDSCLDWQRTATLLTELSQKYPDLGMRRSGRSMTSL